jgi:hypothetical protein
LRRRSPHRKLEEHRRKAGATPLELNQRSADYGSVALLLS